MADSYDPLRCAELCEHIAEGASVHAACKATGLAHRTVYHWLASHDDFRAMFGDARSRQANRFADEIIAIADDPANAESSENLQAARLRVDARKWITAKLMPKVYGDKVAVDVDANVTQYVVEVPIMLSRDEWLKQCSGVPSPALRPGS